MRRKKIELFLPLFFIVLTPQLLHADKHADNKRAEDLDAKYKTAMSKHEIDQATGYICDAAKLDPKKYEKRCASAQKYAADQLLAYDGLIGTGKFEMDHKDYAGAVRDLSKIYFGPHREEAQHILQQATYLLGHPQEIAESTQALNAAQAAYDRGDLTTAAANAKAVQVNTLQPAAQQILTNIRIYNEAIQLGDTYMQDKNYAAAQQKYKFALVIVANGPGDPTGKLQQIAALLASSTPPASPSAEGKTAAKNEKKLEPPTANDTALKIKTALAEAHAAESKQDTQAALSAFEQVLAINPRQPEALAGKQKILDSAQKDPQELEIALKAGIRSYYQSQLAEANDKISHYLTAGGTLHKGAAYFYLGATFATETLLSAPQSAEEHTLRQRALQEFKNSKCESYKPIERFLSPKVLAIWNESAC